MQDYNLMGVSEFIKSGFNWGILVCFFFGKNRQAVVKNLEIKLQGWQQASILIPMGGICLPMAPHGKSDFCCKIIKSNKSFQSHIGDFGGVRAPKLTKRP